MSFFDESMISEEFSEEFMGTLVEQFLIDDIVHNWSRQQVSEFCEPGGVGEALVEAKVLGKRTLVRLSKADDLDRRTTLAAMAMAKEKKDPLFDKLALNRVKEKELLSKIKAKYGTRSLKAAKEGQKAYIKTMKKVPMSFMKAGGADRL